MNTNMLSSVQARESRQCLRVWVCVCVCLCVAFGKKSACVFAEKWLSYRNTNVLWSFQAREGGQRLSVCVCMCLCLRLRGQTGKRRNNTSVQKLSSPRDGWCLWVCVCVWGCVCVCVCEATLVSSEAIREIGNCLRREVALMQE